MIAQTLPRVIFYRVKENATKIQLICKKGEEAFSQEKRLLIAVPNFQAAQYIEELLWRNPRESFMPHVVTDTPTSEWIAITMQNEKNVNQATRLLNLCTTPSPFYEHIKEIYEFYDASLPEKGELSEQRLQYYTSKGCVVKIEGKEG